MESNRQVQQSLEFILSETKEYYYRHLCQMYILLVTVIFVECFSAIPTTLDASKACYKVKNYPGEYVAFTSPTNQTQFPPYIRLTVQIVLQRKIADYLYYMRPYTLHLLYESINCTKTLPIRYGQTRYGFVSHQISLQIGNSDTSFRTYHIGQKGRIPSSIHELRDFEDMFHLLVEFDSNNELSTFVPKMSDQLSHLIRTFEYRYMEIDRLCIHGIHKNKAFLLEFAPPYTSDFELSSSVTINIWLYKTLNDMERLAYVYQYKFDGFYLDCSKAKLNLLEPPNILYPDNLTKFYLLWEILEWTYSHRLESLYQISDNSKRYIPTNNGVDLIDITLRRFAIRGDISLSEVNTVVLETYSEPELLCSPHISYRINDNLPWKYHKEILPCVTFQSSHYDGQLVNAAIRVYRSYGDQGEVIYSDTPTPEEVKICNWRFPQHDL